MIHSNEFLKQIVREYEKNAAQFFEKPELHKVLRNNFKAFCRLKGIRCVSVSTPRFAASLQFSWNGTIKLSSHEFHFGRVTEIEVKDSQRAAECVDIAKPRDQPFYILHTNEIRYYWIDGNCNCIKLNHHFTLEKALKRAKEYGMQERKHLND